MNDQPPASPKPAIPELGQLVSVDVRSVWAREDVHFTPWLAKPDNLALLSRILQLGPLVVEGTEVAVGSFLLDILAKDAGGGYVIIENQFGPTDHTHLGQIMTYLAGQEGAATVVWIAERFREEHRAVVDWLNANTPETSNFFAAELEVLRIGTSPPAPWFNVVAKPNKWSRGVKQATQTASDAPTNPGQIFNIEYWNAFTDYLADRGSSFRFKLPNKQRYAYAAVSPSLLVTNAWIKPDGGSNNSGLQVDLWIGGKDPKGVFKKLLEERAALETSVGETLQWEERPDTKGSRIAVTTWAFNCEDKSTWSQQFAWLSEHLDKMRDVFLPRVKAISEAAE